VPAADDDSSGGLRVPTYQYACTECAHAFEQVQTFSDDALTTCPECSGRLRKVFNAVGVVFKGSGFYRTDSRSGATSGAPAKTGDRGSGGSASGDSGSKGADSGSKGSDSGSKGSDGTSSATTTSGATATK